MKKISIWSALLTITTAGLGTGCASAPTNAIGEPSPSGRISAVAADPLGASLFGGTAAPTENQDVANTDPREFN